MFDTDVEKELSPKETGNSQVRTRCPDCFKLYSIDASEIKASKPKFSCLECKSKFWLPFPEAMESQDIIMGFPMDWIEPASSAETLDRLEEKEEPSPALDIKAFSCPKCEEPYAASQSECQSCGIVFNKFLEIQERPKSKVSAPKEARGAWDELLQNYESFEAHQKFVSTVQKLAALDYAFDQYEVVLEANPHDDLAKRAQNLLSCLAVTKAESSMPISKYNWFREAMPKIKFASFLYFLSAVIIAMGIIMPELRNLVGFGSAVLFSALALRFYFRVL